MQKTSLIYPLLMLLGAASYGLTPAFLKLGYGAGYDVADITSTQYGIAAVVIWLVTLFDWRRQRFPRRQWIRLFGIGLSVAATSYSYYVSLTVLPASLGIVLLFQFAWIVMVIDMLATKTLPSKEKWVGMVMIIVGTILAVGLMGTPIVEFPPLWAIGLGLMSALFYALTLYISGYVGGESTPLARSAISISISNLVLIPVFPPRYLFSGVLWDGLWLWALLLALTAQVIPMLLMLKSIPHIGGRMAGVLGTVELPVTVFCAILILHESVSWAQLVGALLIIAGILVSEFRGLLYERLS